MYKKCESEEEEGGEDSGRWSVLQVWLPSSAYKLQPPWKMGVGAMRRLRLWPEQEGWVAVIAALPIWWSGGQSMMTPWVVGMGQKVQQPLAGVTQAPWDFTLWRWPPRRRPPLLGLG